MNNNKAVALATFIGLGKMGSGNQKEAGALSNILLMLVLQLDFTGTISTVSCTERMRGSLESRSKILTSLIF